MYKAESCKICGQSIKLYDCEKCYGLCERAANDDTAEKQITELKQTEDKK